MRESLRDEPKPIFEKGMLVKLRDDVPRQIESQLAPDVVKDGAYRIVYVETKDDGREMLWLAPSDIPLKEVDDFSPQALDEEITHRFDRVFSVPLLSRYFITAHN